MSFIACVAGVERGRGYREEGKKGGGLGRKGRAPFPFPFRAFLPHPPPPLFAPATQAMSFKDE